MQMSSLYTWILASVCPKVESSGLAAANFSMESEPLLNRAGQGLCSSVQYVYRKGGTSVLSLNTWTGRLLNEKPRPAENVHN